ncbi:MAG: ethylbenzene dehydrogenase-related protein [Planctomycetota bacterium]
MEKNYLLLKKCGVVMLSFVFLSVTLFASEEMMSGVKGMDKDEFTPAKEILVVKHVQTIKACQLDVESLKDAFNNAKEVKITLQKQDKAFPYGGGSISSVNIKAIHDGITICFQILWKDPIKNSRAIAVQEFGDAVALMFPLGVMDVTPEEHFSPRMGDREKPTNIWHWKADWEVDLLAGGEMKDIEKRYPNMQDDFYSNPYIQDYCQELMMSAEHMSGGIAANNLLSVSWRGRTVEDLNAEGFGTLTTQDQQDVNGFSKYKDGVWTVIMYRLLITKDHDDIQFVPGGKTYFNIAVWDGGKKDRNGQKNISIQWHPVILDKVKYN